MRNRCFDPECVLCKGRSYPAHHWLWQTAAALALVVLLAWASQW